MIFKEQADLINEHINNEEVKIEIDLTHEAESTVSV